MTYAKILMTCLAVITFAGPAWAGGELSRLRAAKATPTASPPAPTTPAETKPANPTAPAQASTATTPAKASPAAKLSSARSAQPARLAPPPAESIEYVNRLANILETSK